MAALRNADSANHPLRLWKAKRDATIFNAPQGIAAAQVAAATIIEEHSTYVDMFDGQWISFEHDDGIFWIRPKELHLEDVDGSVQQVFSVDWDLLSDSESAAIAAEGAAGGTKFSVAPSPPSSRDAPRSPHREHSRLPPQPLPLISHDLKKISSQEVRIVDQFWQRQTERSFRNWNNEYQQCLEKLMFEEGGTSEEKHSLLTNFVSQLTDECEKVIRTIVSEITTAQSKRTIPAVNNSDAMHIYLHNGVLYRVCVDANGVFGSDEGVMKYAAQEYKAIQHLNGKAPQLGLMQPCCILMTFYGFRVLAMTIPPVSLKNLVAGSSDGGETCVSPVHPYLEKTLDHLGLELNLKKHVTGTNAEGEDVMSVLPLNAGVYAGFDGRLYVLDVGRLLPPLVPTVRHHSYVAATSGLFRRHRSELVVELERPLSSDAYLKEPFDHESSTDCLPVTHWLHNSGFGILAAVFGFHTPTNAYTATYVCVGCGETKSDDIGFTLCPKGCCYCCPECNMALSKIAFWDGQEEEAVEKLKSWVKCDTGYHGLKGFEMSPSVTAIFHAHGVNMRYLQYVYARLAATSRACCAHYLEIEMISRAAKNLMWKTLRRMADAEERKQFLIEFYLALLQPEGPRAEAFWSESLGPAITDTFDVHSPFDTSMMDRRLLCHRVGALSGVELTEPSIESFTTDEPFVQLQPPHPTMKQVRLPRFVDAPGELKEYLDLAGLTDFWSATIAHFQLEANMEWQRRLRPVYWSQLTL